jgi:hypothetical protein
MKAAIRYVFVLSLLLIALMPVQHSWAKNCKKGIPCGNSCISPKKVCRIGQGVSSNKEIPISVSNHQYAQPVSLESGQNSVVELKPELYEVINSEALVYAFPFDTSELVAKVQVGQTILVVGEFNGWFVVDFMNDRLFVTKTSLRHIK